MYFRLKMRSEVERKMAQIWRKEGFSFSEIGKKIGISKDAAVNLCKYKKASFKCKTGPKNLLTFKDKFSIKRQISILNSENKKVNSTVLKFDCGLSVSNRTIQRYLTKIDMRYQKAHVEIVLNKKDKQLRMDTISNWICHDIRWEKVIFSDEKCFSLDGPYDWRSYSPKKNKIVRQRRQCRGGSIMVWLFCMPNGLLGYRLVNGTLNSKGYINYLKKSLLPIVKLNYKEDYIFQDDNASVHRATIVKEFIENNNINVLKWPPKSPDMNIVENIWKLLSDNIYNGTQYRNKQDLEAAIKYWIDFFNQNKRENIMDLYHTFRHRLVSILKSNGSLLNSCK